MIDMLTQSGVSLDTLKQTNPELIKSGKKAYQNKAEEQYNAQIEAISAAGGDVAKFKEITKNINFEDLGNAAFEKAYTGKDLPDYTKMGTFVQEQSAAQKANTEAVKTLTTALGQASAGAENAKTATFNTALAAATGTQVPGTQPDWLNTLLAGGGVGGGLISSAIGGAFGAGAANVGTKVVGGTVNVGKNVVAGAGRGIGTAAPAIGRALFNPYTAAAAGGAAVGYGISQIPVGNGENVASTMGNAMYNMAPTLFGGPSKEQQAQQETDFKRQIEEIKNRKKQKEQTPTQETTTQANKEKPTETTNNISVAPNINIAQAAANDKAELQKMIEAEVKKFGEGLLKIVEEKSRNMAKGTVTPPQSMRTKMAA